jgi:hypothetical protein
LLTCHLCRKYASQIEQLGSSMKLYREESHSEHCTHHLTPESVVRIQQTVERELNVK